MKPLWDRLRTDTMRPWSVIGASISALILAILVASIVLIQENERLLDIIERALTYDIEIEDEGDDVRIAVLDLRHFQRNIMFEGPSGAALAAFDQGYASLLEEIADLEALGLSDFNVVAPSEFRARATTYYEDFRSATALYETDPVGFARSASEALRRIEELDREAGVIDEIGERLAASSLGRVQEAASRERVILIASTAGIVIVGIAMAVSAWRLVSRLAATSQREQHIAAELARSLRLRTDFIADASHELRTPLTVIQGNAEIGLTTPGPETPREILTEIANEASRMGRLVDDLLFLARSDSGRTPLELDYVSARWLMGRLVRPAEVLARQRGSCLETSVAGDGYLELDPSRIEQVVQILVDNAARHSPPGACIELRSRIVNQELEIAVSDQGEGIPADQLTLIFDRFHRVGAGRRRAKGGAGLGLAIAKSIVEAHRGSIHAESRVGAGTTMIIRLPVVPHAAALSPPPGE